MKALKEKGKARKGRAAVFAAEYMNVADTSPETANVKVAPTQVDIDVAVFKTNASSQGSEIVPMLSVSEALPTSFPLDPARLNPAIVPAWR